MRAFRFRLARVLRVRRLQEEVARGELHAARGAARIARTAADEAAAEVERGRDELLAWAARPRLEPAGLVVRHAAQDVLRTTRESRDGHARQLESEVELRRAAALEARSSVRGLERLEQRRRGAHAAELERVERGVQEEVAQRRAARRLLATQPPGRGPGSSPKLPASDESPPAARRSLGASPSPTDPR